MWGSDRSGRDVYSRNIYSSRISLTIGLVGVAFSLFLGVLVGGISGLMGGIVDNIAQRLIEVMMSIPQLPIWIALAALVPITWSSTQVFFITSIIVSAFGWTWMARVVRSKFLSLREEDFVLAAKLDSARPRRLIFKHMLPSFYSHIIASLTLAVPAMIIGETALSFLGLGLRAPTVSWGVLLQDVQQVSVLATAPGCFCLRFRWSLWCWPLTLWATAYATRLILMRNKLMLNRPIPSRTMPKQPLFWSLP